MSLDGKSPVQELLSESGNRGLMRDSLDETIKENASLVDSSFTECKYDRENSHGTGCSSDKDNEECNGDTRQHIHDFGDMKNSPMRNDKRPTTRYFIIKSLNHDNIQLSIEKGIWATQVMNEPILDEAFHNSDRVILIFSVNMSGFFQGYAQMMSSVGWARDNSWSRSSGGKNWGRTFRVKWLQLNDLPFQKTLHLKNPLNDYKPVKISRDCQELSQEVGEALCGLFDEEVDIIGRCKRDSPVNFQEDDCHLAAPSHLGWAGSTMLHPPLLYQHIEAQETLPSSSFPHGSPFYMESSEFLFMRESQIHGSTNRRGDKATFLPRNGRDTPGEGSFAVSLSEDDILNMTYEEYLEAVGRSLMPSPHLAGAGQTRPTQGSQSSTEQDVDPYCRYLASWKHPKKGKNHIRSFQ